MRRITGYTGVFWIADLYHPGVPRMVCPACLTAAGDTEYHIISGVTVADKKNSTFT
jgi:hypothetical protein